MSAPPSTTIKLKKPRQSRKVKIQPRTIQEFYSARGKDPKNFRINERGELVAAPVRDGDVEKIFTLPPYRELTVKEKIAVDADRRLKIAEAENTVQEAQKTLRDTIAAFHAGDAYASEVVLMNQEVSVAEKALQSLAWPQKQIVNIPRIDIRRILLEKPYEERKMSYSVYQFKHYPTEFQEAYVSEKGLVEEAEDESQAQGPDQGQDEVRAPMTAAERARMGGIIKLRKSRPPGQ